MSHYIRWQGFGVFAFICMIIFALIYAFANPLAKLAIEQGASQYSGAEVNVERVDVAFSPFSVTVFDLQATDPKQPTHNMVSVEQAKASISLWPYLFGQTIIDELDVTSLKLNSERKAVGAVYVTPKSDDALGDPLDDNWLATMEENLPDPITLLDNANLKTVKRAGAFEESYAEEKAKLAAIKQQLPSKEKLQAFEQKVKELTKTGVNGIEDIERIKNQFETLKKEFKAEQAKVKAAQETFNESKSILSQRLTDLRNAPAEDWHDIETKYQLDQLDAQDFAHILFGDKAREYYQVAELVFVYIKPLLEKSSSDEGNLPTNQAIEGGRFVHFVEENALPNFWLKKGNVSIELPQGIYQVTLNDVTLQHWLIDKKSTLLVNADRNTAAGDVNFSTAFEVTQESKITADGYWNLANISLKDISMKESEKLSLALVKGILSGQGKFDVNNRQLNLTSDFALADNEFSGMADSKLANVILDTLKSLEQLSLNLGAKGDLFSPNWSVSSSLDNIVAQALKQQVSAKLTKYKATLQAGLNSKLQGTLDLGNSQEQELIDLEALLSQSDNALEKLKNNDVVKQKRKELEDKAKDKLKEKLGKIFG